MGFPRWSSWWLIVFTLPLWAVLRQVIGEAIEAYPKDLRINWVRAWPGQTVLCVSQVYWTKDIHQAIVSGPKVGPQRIHYFFFLICDFLDMILCNRVRV